MLPFFFCLGFLVPPSLFYLLFVSNELTFFLFLIFISALLVLESTILFPVFLFFWFPLNYMWLIFRMVVWVRATSTKVRDLGWPRLEILRSGCGYINQEKGEETGLPFSLSLAAVLLSFLCLCVLKRYIFCFLLMLIFAYTRRREGVGAWVSQL